MRPLAALSFCLPLCLFLTGCTAAMHDIEPVPGSITYGAGPTTRLTKSPVGSIVFHQFRDKFDREWEERYVVQPGGSLKLVDRRRYHIPDD
ncbi:MULTISPECIES: hypothetical protein [Alphaproteobacteria]|uniref:Membrane protein n=2 Tax=Alphaproteobacteria TaxID=28211 RepID=A0A512HP12_9HYPH|nr:MULTISPECIES: hypothetical protein [Alphaproteobacteria]GEO87140.1 membrane protein [Ciceribacter naphthalenivorans]GLR23280.1 membrane protein [Ciceribacter naphthalenivorans]GLT06136.1 membrane protein [Sphingomonas psychrolutea]